MIQTIIIIILLIYSIVISILYFYNVFNNNQILKERENILFQREQELNRRESNLLSKEICLLELTRLRAINKSAVDILKSESIPDISSDMIKNLSESRI